jgi:hypothetical protein
MHLAARRSDVFIIDALFQAGGSLSARDRYGRIPALTGCDPSIRAHLEMLARRRPRCLAATLALFKLRLPRDMRRLLAQLVWRTRRDEDWD